MIIIVETDWERDASLLTRPIRKYFIVKILLILLRKNICL